VHAGFDSYKQARIFVELACADDPVTQLAHHMGHLLGLHPTNYEGHTELVDGSNCATAGDRICDTPADPYGYIRDESGSWTTTPTPELEEYNRGCEFVWKELDDNGQFYNPIVSNIMSPYPCKCQFTYEQYVKMAEYYNAASVKNY